LTADYEAMTRCAACDSDIPERALLDHFDTCKAKADGRSEFHAYGDGGFERAVASQWKKGEVRTFRYEPTPDAGGEVRLAIMPAGCDGQHTDGFPCPDCATPAHCGESGCWSARDLPNQTAFKRAFQGVEVVQTDSLADTMKERNARYGDFRIQARVGKAIRFAMRLAPNWHKLTPSQELALDWISDKIARILCGDTLYSDNWHDLAGYAKLGERDCVNA